MKRLEAGYCRVFDSRGLRFHLIPLDREAVDGIVFWTRNARPFRASLENIRSRGFPFIVQYGITDEHSDAVVADAHAIAHKCGRRTIVWRYDLISLSERAAAWHTRNFEALAEALEGATDQVVVAFASDSGEPDEREEKRSLLKALSALARARGILLSLCSQPAYLVPGAMPARCIDTRRLSEIAGRDIGAGTNSRWPGCLCATAQDIGLPLDQSSEALGPALVPRRMDHEEDGEFLVPPASRFTETDITSLPF